MNGTICVSGVPGFVMDRGQCLDFCSHGRRDVAHYDTIKLVTLVDDHKHHLEACASWKYQRLHAGRSERVNLD